MTKEKEDDIAKESLWEYYQEIQRLEVLELSGRFREFDALFREHEDRRRSLRRLGVPV